MAQATNKPKTAVVIGTSPIMLCAAITLAENGWHVKAIEERDRPGGAWRTISAFGCDRVEPAVHLLENRARTYRHLAEDLGVVLEPEKRCIGVFRGRMIGFHVTRIACFIGVGMKGLLRGDINKARLGFGSAVRSARSLRTPFLYPKTGSSSLVEDLVMRASTLPIEFVFNTTINDIRINGRQDNGTPAGVCQSARETWPFDKIFITSRAHATIVMNGKPVGLAPRGSTIHSLLLLIRVRKNPGIGYVEVLADDLIRRVRDVGRFAAPGPEEGTMILAVQLKTRNPVTGEHLNDVAGRVMKRLQKLRILAEDATLLEHQLEAFTHRTIPNATVRALAESTGSFITGLTTTDFAEELATLLERPAATWESGA